MKKLFTNSRFLSIFVIFFICNTVEGQSGAQLYDQVQNIYVSASRSGGSNCNQIKSYVSQIEGYRGYSQPVPSAKAYSVNFPNKVNNPSIGALANDRISKLKSRFKSCFNAPASARSVELYNSVQNLYGRYYNITSNDCNSVSDLISSLNAYKNYRQPVPADKAYTVSFKRKVTNPTIGDLAEDRIARVQSRFKNCNATGNTREMELYNTVQNIYISAPRRQSMLSTECASVNSIIARLEPYQRYGELVPQDLAYTVIYPNKRTNPTIGDLACDRIERLKMLNRNCNNGPEMSNYALTNLPGVYNYNHKGRKYQLTITRVNNSLKAAFTSHEYSYPPIYEGAEVITNNMVTFKFVLGGSYKVALDVAHNRLGVSAYIYESWEGESNVNLGVISAPVVKRSDEISTDGSVKVTFYNNTSSSVRVYWINFQGVEVKYFDLAPGNSYIQPTYNTHKWRVRQGNSVLLNYTANNLKNQSVYVR